MSKNESTKMYKGGGAIKEVEMTSFNQIIESMKYRNYKNLPLDPGFIQPSPLTRLSLWSSLFYVYGPGSLAESVVLPSQAVVLPLHTAPIVMTIGLQCF